MMKRERFHTIVVGAGPAGSFCAYQLALGGQRVALLERCPFPRYKACGGAVSMRAQELLPFDISPVIERRIHEILFTLNGEKPIYGAIEKPFTSLVMRSRFDSFLLGKAQEEGVFFFPGTSGESFFQDDQGVSLRTHDGLTFTGDFLVGADGVSSRVAGSFQLNQYQQKGFAIAGEICTSSTYFQETGGIIHIDPGVMSRGYGWIFPKSNHLSIGVGQFGDRDPRIRHHFQSFIGKWDLLEEGRLETLKGAFLPMGGKIGDLITQRVLLVGDAAGLVDPLSGEGIYYALKSALMAAEVLLKEDLHLSDYQRLIRTEFEGEFLSSRRLYELFYHFTPFAYQILERNPEILENLLEMMTGKISHRLFYERMKGYIPIMKRLVTS